MPLLAKQRLPGATALGLLSVGKPFRVTAFENPALMLPDQITKVEVSVTQDRLVLTLEDLSGSIWMLDNVGP